MNVWINGRAGARIDWRDRGLHYGDGLFETMRVRRGAVRFLDAHLERLFDGCARLGIRPPPERRLRGEIARAAALGDEAVLKLILTRGPGARGYRPSGRERTTRILSRGAPPHAGCDSGKPIAVRICRTRLGWSEALAGMKTLNRLESVLARAEWRDPRIAEGLMLDPEGHVVCGTMSNVFLRHGAVLTTPLVDRCGVAGVMRRFVLGEARSLGLRPVERRVQVRDFATAGEVFMCNAVRGLMSVGAIRRGGHWIRPREDGAARRLRSRLDAR